MVISTPISAQESCHLLQTSDSKKDVWISLEDIKESGEYCLSHDIKAPRVHDSFGERGFPNSEMLRIKASEVVFDLHGYTMNVEATGMAGISSGYWRDSSSKQRITIRNGVIKNRTQSAIAFYIPYGSLLSDFKTIFESPQTVGMAERAFLALLRALPQNAAAYQKTEYVIADMKIESGSVSKYSGVRRQAIGMKGAANIIRNNTIEVTGGHAAIYLFGPNQLIENNIIIFKGKAAVESAAAIKLHQADGTIIRNNDIIIESVGDEAPKAAISLIDSKNVVAENNRIYGIKTLVHAWDDKSNLIDRNNDFRSMVRRPWPGAEPGVR